jgi:hypothetical protein
MDEPTATERLYSDALLLLYDRRRFMVYVKRMNYHAPEGTLPGDGRRPAGEISVEWNPNKAIPFPPVAGSGGRIPALLPQKLKP